MHAYIFVLISFASIAHARVSGPSDYEAMQKAADLVVIATPLKRIKSERIIDLPNIKRVRSGSRDAGPIKVIPIETSFFVRSFLKGTLPNGENQFRLQHFIEVNPPDEKNVAQGNPIRLIDFVAGDGSSYLLFLKWKDDGSLGPVSGDADAGQSIEKLQLRYKRKGEPANEAIQPPPANERSAQ